MLILKKYHNLVISALASAVLIAISLAILAISLLQANRQSAAGINILNLPVTDLQGE